MCGSPRDFTRHRGPFRSRPFRCASAPQTPLVRCRSRWAPQKGPHELARTVHQGRCGIVAALPFRQWPRHVESRPMLDSMRGPATSSSVSRGASETTDSSPAAQTPGPPRALAHTGRVVDVRDGWSALGKISGVLVGMRMGHVRHDRRGHRISRDVLAVARLAETTVSIVS